VNSQHRRSPFPINLRQLTKIAAAILVGLLLGLLVILTPYLPFSSDLRNLVLVIPFTLLLVILFNDLEKLILAAMVTAVPLNLDYSVIISPYARNIDNLARGYRTIIGVTELRLSFIFIILIIGYAFWLVKPGFSSKKSIHLFASATLPAAGLLFFSIISSFRAPDTQLAFFRIAQLVEVFLAYFYLVNHLKVLQDLEFYVIVSLLGLLAESTLMIVQWITGLTFSFAGIGAVIIASGRIAGTLGTTGPAAGYLSALLMIALAVLWGHPKKALKLLAAASFITGTIALVSTGSRIGWIGFAVTLIVFLVVGVGKGHIKSRSLILPILIAMIIGSIFFSQIYGRFVANDNGSAQSRPMMWKLAENVIRAHPWLGVGAGNYPLVNRDYYTPDVGHPQYVYDIEVHNLYLIIWAESGVFALLCFLVLMAVSIISAWSGIRSQSIFVFFLGLGLSLAIFSLCIQMITDTFHVRSINLMVWSLIALATSFRRIAQKKENQNNGWS
jgi:O-antigen ligase